MQYTVTVESQDSTAMGWILEYCEWLGWNAPTPVDRLVPLQPIGNGKFVGLLDLPADRIWRFKCTITIDHAVAINLDPSAGILWPRNAAWPVAASGPEVAMIYFATGDGQ
jgi:hypothetical protein